MKKNPKILVLHMREIIYTLIFLVLGILLIVLLVNMFSPHKSSAPTSSYIPGIYTSSLTLGSRQVEVEAAVDADRIRGIRLVNLEESIAVMYPLMEPAMEALEEQILSSQSPDQIIPSGTQKYTQTALLNAIKEALDSAKK